MTLDAMGARYGQRPSAFVSGLSRFQALTVDLAAANEGWKHELKA
jgi:hypothetical protein